MATPVDELVIEIRAETAKLRKGLDKVQTQLGAVNKSAKSSMLTFGSRTRNTETRKPGNCLTAKP